VKSAGNSVMLVGVVKSGWREGEIVVRTTLDQMADQGIGMLTTIIIGNSQTYYFKDLMVTPRGYRKKYDLVNKGGDLERLKEKEVA
jgi:precorrin-3B C17-methyltransferase